MIAIFTLLLKFAMRRIELLAIATLTNIYLLHSFIKEKQSRGKIIELN